MGGGAMSIKLAPGLINDMVEYLEDNLQSHLTAEETIWGDGIALPEPNGIIKRDPDDPRRMNNPPYLYVVVSRSPIYDWSSAHIMSQHQLILWLVAQDSDPEQLRTMIYRYGNALFKCLIAADGSLDYRMAQPAGANMPELDYGETLTRGNVAMADVRVTSWWSGMEEA